MCRLHLPRGSPVSRPPPDTAGHKKSNGKPPGDVPLRFQHLHTPIVPPHHRMRLLIPHLRFPASRPPPECYDRSKPSAKPPGGAKLGFRRLPALIAAPHSRMRCHLPPRVPVPPACTLRSLAAPKTTGNFQGALCMGFDTTSAFIVPPSPMDRGAG
ncbi:hypothetical protein M422DRAFT_267306 [Sphaerobolus stellatus SS14]|uniref:Uncharacterized protein n=1 Tax=Sphaerobolus stellatus (strain SS14) TaxID=990650 RepID=A0A0C9TMA9_SPHS4|nr:hypothetical protein M422DRAFT_267306 [Sphaerobolus stellatus SS14]